MDKTLNFKIISSTSKCDSNLGSANLLEQSSPSKPPSGAHAGWISARNPIFPQEILVHLDADTSNLAKINRIEVLSHHFLIAKRVEFFISGDGGQYKRLGYVKMSDNIDTQYKARELKSIHLNATGKFLKILIHENYDNMHNKHSQVGIVAVAFHGQTFTPSQLITENIINTNLNQLTENNNNIVLEQAKGLNRPKNSNTGISPIQALMNDSELGSHIVNLQEQKSQAILNEQYDTCIKIKSIQDYISNIAITFVKLDVQKRDAIQNEDYLKAKEIKVKIDEIRNLIKKKISGENNSQNIDPNIASKQNYVPTIIHKVPEPEIDHNLNIPNKTPSSIHSSPRIEHDDLVLPAVALNKQIDFNKVDEYSNPNPGASSTKDLIKLTKHQEHESEAFIEVFGEQLTIESYSKKFDHRIAAMQSVLQMISSNKNNLNANRPATARAILSVLMRLFKDKVVKVFEAACVLFIYIVSDQYLESFKDSSYIVDKCLPLLLQVSGESNKFLREAAQTTIIKLDQVLRLSGIVPQHVLVPFNYRKKLDSKHAASRIQLARKLLQDRQNQFDQDNMSIKISIDFALKALDHTDGKVRDEAINYIADVHRAVLTAGQSGNVVRRMLPIQSEDYMSLKKSSLWRQIYDILDKIEGKPTASELANKKIQDAANAEMKKKHEIEELQNQIANLKSLADQVGNNPQKPSIKPTNSELKSSSTYPSDELPASSKPIEGVEESDLGDEHVCIFCGERNEEFNETGLDLHYWKYCPMLKRCEYCGQVIEIAAFHEHLLQECESKDQIPKVVKDEMTRERNSKVSHCSLCKKKVEKTEEGWQKHLMGDKGCLANPRRLPFLKRMKKGR